MKSKKKVEEDEEQEECVEEGLLILGFRGVFEEEQ